MAYDIAKNPNKGNIPAFKDTVAEWVGLGLNNFADEMAEVNYLHGDKPNYIDKNGVEHGAGGSIHINVKTARREMGVYHSDWVNRVNSRFGGYGKNPDTVLFEARRLLKENHDPAAKKPQDIIDQIRAQQA